jgi:hypothetical protein
MQKAFQKRLKKLSSLSFLFLVALIFTSLSGLLNVLAADNDATQEASTARAATISVVGKVADTAVTSITFPQGSPGSTVSNPYNNVDTDSSSQFLDGTASEPVVRLKNTAGLGYQVILEITSWTNSVADAEYYELVSTDTVNVAAVNDVLSSDGDYALVSTGVSIDSAAYKALYLSLDLSGVANKIGTSTLSVLGESI